MGWHAILHNSARGMIGHGFLIAEDLLMTCAHVVGDVDSAERPFAHPIVVKFKNGVEADGFLHDRGWFPLEKAALGFSADIAILRLNWKEKPPSILSPVELLEELPAEPRLHLDLTIESGSRLRAQGDATDSRAWTSPRMTLLSSLGTQSEVLELSLHDQFDPETEKGWSGAPVICIESSKPFVVAMWNGAPKSKFYRGHAISARLLNKARDYCLSSPPIWKSRAWQPHFFTDEVRNHVQPHEVETGTPVTGRIGILERSAASEQVQPEVVLATGLAGVCTLMIPDAGVVSFGIVSARLTIEVQQMALRPFNRVGREGARAKAQLETMPMHDGLQQVRYRITPTVRGDVLMGNTLCGDRDTETAIAEARVLQGANAGPTISGSLKPEFRVIDVKRTGHSTEEITEEVVETFKKFLLEKLMGLYAINDGEIELAVTDER